MKNINIKKTVTLIGTLFIFEGLDLAMNPATYAMHSSEMTEEECNKSTLRKQGDEYFYSGQYQLAFEKYKRVAEIASFKNLNDVRNCADACRRMSLSLPETDPNREEWFREWAQWAVRAAQHSEKTIQDLRNAASVLYSVQDYGRAAEFRKQAAEHPQTEWADLKRAALTFQDAKKEDAAKYWYEKALQSVDASGISQDEINRFKSSYKEAQR